LEHRVLGEGDETGADITEIREALCVCVCLDIDFLIFLTICLVVLD
jgi:hypothetical protein